MIGSCTATPLSRYGNTLIDIYIMCSHSQASLAAAFML